MIVKVKVAILLLEYVEVVISLSYAFKTVDGYTVEICNVMLGHDTGKQ